jgi:hypothetical protein
VTALFEYRVFFHKRAKCAPVTSLYQRPKSELRRAAALSNKAAMDKPDPVMS